MKLEFHKDCLNEYYVATGLHNWVSCPHLCVKKTSEIFGVTSDKIEVQISLTRKEKKGWRTCFMEFNDDYGIYGAKVGRHYVVIHYQTWNWAKKHSLVEQKFWIKISDCV